LEKILQNKINIFRSIFKGREDVFAIRWEKGNKSGYAPAKEYDPYFYRISKINKSENTNYLPLIDDEIFKHLSGEKLIGIYPLLKDNTSWFIAADFDEQNWLIECDALIAKCKEFEIPVYLERSRSGNGGHVWIFFETPYPAEKSRKILIALLQKSKVISVLDKNSSFDRLFPNQDYHSGKGFGNLIALPLFKKSFIEGNSCFIDVKTGQPFKDQWKYLEEIQKISIEKLNSIYQSLLKDYNKDYPITNTENSNENLDDNILKIRLSNSVFIQKRNANTKLIHFLKDELNFVNSEYIIKKKMGKNTWEMERYFKLFEESEKDFIIPRGMIGQIIRFCKSNKIEYEFSDDRKKLKEINYSFNAQLKDYQKNTIEITNKKEFGIIVAPPGSGKTIIGLKIIANKNQPALIVVHRKQIAEQWIERIETFLGIPKREIGIFGEGKSNIGKQITIAMFQTLSKKVETEEFKTFCKSFGIIIIDECHHVPAQSFRNVISKFSTFYQYGLTATPFRKNNDTKLIFIYLGEIISEIKLNEIEPNKHAKIIIRETDFYFPFNSKINQFEDLSKVLIHDTKRNELILKDVYSVLNSGKKAVIITERIEHIHTLSLYLRLNYEVVTLSGDDNTKSRNDKWNILKKGDYQVLITTGQFFGEGSDLQNVANLFLVYPFSFKGKLIQYIGRVQRSEIAPVIYDYHDVKTEYLHKLFLKRNVYYRKFEKQAVLFDDNELNEEFTKDLYTIEEKIKVKIEELDFRYGLITFKYKLPINIELTYEIENDAIRPEFEVLKPYFAKHYKSDYLNVDIFTEIKYGKVLSQNANCIEIENIDKEIIEGMKFNFIEYNIFKGKSKINWNKNTLNISELQYGNNLYTSENEFIDEILKNKATKHYRQLRYLSENHCGSILKIRFVLQPFSFIFLLEGNHLYHIVLETLDTEEATYIWHIKKEISELREKIKQIDDDLNTIKNHGRQFFIENQPENFSRIFHDYSDERKGFVIWKSIMEEKLY